MPVEKSYYERLGYNIYQIRRRRGISQEKLAEGANCSQKYISQIESGQARLSAFMCAKIALALNTSMDSLFFDVAENEEQSIHTANEPELVLLEEISKAVQHYLEAKK